MRVIAIVQCLLCASWAIPSAFGQAWQESVTVYLEGLRSGKQLHAPRIATEIEPFEALRFLTSFASDSSEIVKIKVSEMAYTYAHHSADPDVRRAAVDLLTDVCVAGSEATGVAVAYLETFHSKDFTSAAKENIEAMIVAGHSHLKELIKIAGFLNLQRLIPMLKEKTTNGNRSDIRWSATISLARMGDKDAAAQMMKRIKRLPVNDEVVYHLFPDLIYSRYPDAIHYLVEAVHSDARNCLAADAESQTPIPCAYRVMEQLASVLKGFPVKLDQSGDLKTTDYPGALITVRKWLRQQTDYKTINETY